MDQLQPTLARFDAFLSTRLPFLTDLEKRYGIPKSALALAPCLVLLAMLVYSFGALSLATVSGFLYPTWKSLATVSVEGPRDAERAMLVYWLVFGAFAVTESFGGVVVG
jgi:receptor expression-enhancing protein 5/6